MRLRFQEPPKKWPLYVVYFLLGGAAVAFIVVVALRAAGVQVSFPGFAPKPGTASGTRTNVTNLPATPCVLSETPRWTNECSATCGGGVQHGVYDIVQQPTNGGAPCPLDADRITTRSCNTQPCPVDCQVSPWGDWSSCDKSCGGGTQSRMRSVLVQDQYGGASCPALSESQSCNTQPCPVDCQVSEWSDWSTCDKTCGGGTQSRMRSVLVQPQNGGAACPALSETQACNTQACEAFTKYSYGLMDLSTRMGNSDSSPISVVLENCKNNPSCKAVYSMNLPGGWPPDHFYFNHQNVQWNAVPWPYGSSIHLKN